MNEKHKELSQRGLMGGISLRIKIDPHIHSMYSDGSSTIEEIIRSAMEKGLHGIAITDHNTLEGYHKAKARDSDLLKIPGFEVSTDAGHVLVLGLERLPSGIETISYEDLIGWARRLGGSTVLAHPAAVRTRLDRWMACKPDAVEVVNALYPSTLYFVDKGLRIAEELNLPVVAGSDSHIPQTVGDSYTVVEVDSMSPASVIEAFKGGSTACGGSLSSFPIRLRGVLGHIFKMVNNPSSDEV